MSDLQWEYDGKNWYAPSILTDNGDPFYWRIRVLDDGHFTAEETDKELSPAFISIFSSLVLAQRDCQAKENELNANLCKQPDEDIEGEGVFAPVNGGPAFPVIFEGGQNNGETPTYMEGMSLRDWFAGQALVGLFSIEANPRVGVEAESFSMSKHTDDMAQHAYELADAMLKARGQ